MTIRKDSLANTIMKLKAYHIVCKHYMMILGWSLVLISVTKPLLKRGNLMTLRSVVLTVGILINKLEQKQIYKYLWINEDFDFQQARSDSNVIEI